MHSKSLERRINTIRRANIKRITTDFDANTGEKLFLYHGKPRKLHSSVSLLIGDAIHNYRSALDHLAWDLVEANHQKPTTKTSFPIFSDPNAYKQVFDKKTAGMSAQAKAIIDSEQPLNAKNPTRGGLLALLNDLDIIDKHRHIYVTLTATDGGMFIPGLPVQVGIKGDYYVHEGPVDENTVLARIPKGYEDTNFVPAFSLSFGPSIPGQGESVRYILIAFDQLVADIINRFDHVLPIYH